MTKYENTNITRYEVDLDNGLPVVGEIVPKYFATYDDLKNDNIQKRRTVNNRITQDIMSIDLAQHRQLRFKGDFKGQSHKKTQ